MRTKQLASLGSAESLTSVTKDEILNKLSDNHIRIYMPDVLQALVPEWAFYFDNGLWHVGLADKPRSTKSQKTPNGFQYYRYVLTLGMGSIRGGSVSTSAQPRRTLYGVLKTLQSYQKRLELIWLPKTSLRKLTTICLRKQSGPSLSI